MACTAIRVVYVSGGGESLATFQASSILPSQRMKSADRALTQAARGGIH
jgi:hypothetical protein